MLQGVGLREEVVVVREDEELGERGGGEADDLRAAGGARRRGEEVAGRGVGWEVAPQQSREGEARLRVGGALEALEERRNAASLQGGRGGASASSL